MICPPIQVFPELKLKRPSLLTRIRLWFVKEQTIEERVDWKFRSWWYITFKKLKGITYIIDSGMITHLGPIQFVWPVEESEK